MQRDLPASLVMTATYLGIKGTRAQQQFLPNTFPAGAVNPCPACPVRIRLPDLERQFDAREPARSRCAAGCTTASPRRSSTRTRSRSTTRRSAGRRQGRRVIAQNWLDLSGERGRSNFDQRHLLNVQVQYTTGMGLARRNAAERMEGRAVQGVDHRHRRSPPAAVCR